MAGWKKSKYYYPFLFIGSLILAIIFYSGIVLKEDITGRLAIGSLWLLVCIGWIIKYAFTKKVKSIL
jgi:hypothetical protein